MILTKYTTFDDGPRAAWKVQNFRRWGFVCFGPYHSNLWHIFYPRNQGAQR